MNPNDKLHLFYHTPIEVPFLMGEVATITVTPPVNNPVYADKAKTELLGYDLKASAVVQLGSKKFTGFTIIENVVERPDGKYRIGNVTVYEPTINRGAGWETKYRRRDMDQMRMAVRIAYMAAKGAHENLVRYAQEDKYGQTCTSCSKCQKPGRGNPDMECRLKMRETVDTQEAQREHDDVIDMGGGRYFQAFTEVIKDFDVTNADMPPWFRECSSLDHAFETICLGLQKDMDLKHHLQVYPFFGEKQVIDPESPNLELDQNAVRQLLLKHDAKHNLGGIFIKLLFGELITRDDYERFPHTISFFMAERIPEDRGARMEYIGGDMLKAYDLDSYCCYGESEYHHAGFLTHQIEMAIDIRHDLISQDKPLIATAKAGETRHFYGFTAVNVNQELFAPKFDDAEMSPAEFITAYVNQLRGDFPTIKPALAKLLSYDKILVVDDEECYHDRTGVGFEIEEGTVVIQSNADICRRHVLAWVLSKVSKRHDLAVHNR